MTARFSSASGYMQDAFIFAFVLLFIDAGARYPLVLIWLGLVLLTAVTAGIISWRKPYRPAPVLLAAIMVMALSLIAGVSVGTFIVLTVISVYRLHARFSEIEDNISGESFFLIIFLIMFTISLVLSILNPQGNSHILLLPLAAAAIIFYTVSRLLYRYLTARKDGAKFWQAAAAAAGISLLAAGGWFLVFLLGDETRRLAGSLVAGILAVVLWPFAGVLNWLLDIINSMTDEENMLSNRDSMEEALEQPETFPSLVSLDFDYTIVAGIAVLLLVVGGILLIRKIKPDPHYQKVEPVAEVSRFSAAAEQPSEPDHAPRYNLVDIHEIRIAYREFEAVAMAAEKGRMDHETVREWALRAELPFTGAFFKTYDKVRYSDGRIDRSEADPFLEELIRIKENFFIKDV